uniref:Odorant receptor n=1 Tax=Trichogramma kaykai TaxID=54128 RepID=A0ABD2W079_9HYME
MFKKLFTINYLPEIPGLVELDKNYGETLIFQFHTTFYVTQLPINWEFAIQNLFELSFVLMMSKYLCPRVYFILGNMQCEIHDYTSMTVNFWDSITDSDQKEYMLNISQFHRRIAILIGVIIFATFIGFAIFPVSVPYCEYIGRKVLMILSAYVLVALSFTGTMFNYENFSAVSYDQFHVQFNKLKPI